MAEACGRRCGRPATTGRRPPRCSADERRRRPSRTAGGRSARWRAGATSGPSGCAAASAPASGWRLEHDAAVEEQSSGELESRACPRDRGPSARWHRGSHVVGDDEDRPPAPWRRTSSRSGRPARRGCSRCPRGLSERPKPRKSKASTAVAGSSSSSGRQSYELEGKPCRQQQQRPLAVAPVGVDPVAAEVLALPQPLPASNPLGQRHRHLTVPRLPNGEGLDGLPAQE